jgi:hypothetical protein
MFEVATLTRNRTLKLPKEIARHFLPSDRFIIWMEGDTLHLKRVTPSPLTTVEQAPADEPLSMDEINEIVHEVRQQRRSHKME